MCHAIFLSLHDMVTVVIPAYNVDKWLQRAVDSLVAQSFDRWKLIIVDDGSTDQTPSVADKIAEADTRVSVVHTANCGAAKARALGVSLADTPLISFLDADDTLAPDALEQLTARLSEDASAVVCGVNRCVDGSSERMGEPLTATVDGRRFVTLLIRGDIRSSLWGCLFRRCDLLKACDLCSSDMTLSEDMLTLVATISDASKVIVDTSLPVYNYHYRSDSATATATLSIQAWVSLTSTLGRFVDNDCDFFLYKLRRLYDCCIVRGAVFSSRHPKIKALIREAGRYQLSPHDKSILLMLRSRLLRSLVARRHRLYGHRASGAVEVSVIMPVYNAPSTLPKAIKSILKQSLRECELIVVDDCSTDSTVDVVNSFAAVDNRVRLLRASSRLGQGGARLLGVKAARGRYVAFIDQDDIMLPDALRQMLHRALLNDADIVVSGSQRLSRRGWLRLPLFTPSHFFTKPTYTTNELIPHLLRRDGFPCSQWDKLYRRSFIDLSRLSAEPAGEDLIFNFLVMSRPGRVAWVDAVGYLWRSGGQSSKPYTQRWLTDLAVYHRMLGLLKESDADDVSSLCADLNQSLVNDFYDKIALGLICSRRASVTRFVADALRTPQLTDALGGLGIKPDVADALRGGRQRLRRHCKFYVATSLLSHL